MTTYMQWVLSRPAHHAQPSAIPWVSVSLPLLSVDPFCHHSSVVIAQITLSIYYVVPDYVYSQEAT